MIIHIWMHWFWITTVYLKGFLLITGQTISLACISHPLVAEAGLRENETSPAPAQDPATPVTPATPDSSQLLASPNTTSTSSFPSDPSPPPTSSPPPPPPEEEEEASTEGPPTTERAEDGPAETGSDVEDVHGGATIDAFQYPTKKITKYTRLKYGKQKTKGKPTDETAAEDRKLESVKVVEEKVNINISITEAEKPETATSDVPDVMSTTTTPNGTSEEANETAVPPRTEPPEASEAPPPPQQQPTEDQKEEEEEEEAEVTKNETLVIESKVEESGTFTTVEPFVVKNRVAAATSAQNYEVGQPDLNAGSITGITLGILVIFSLFGAVSFVLYRRRYLNKPQVLHDKCSNLDSSGYIDETSLRENSEEMYSLDNDSFLNSLEAMTIQNYWTENVKHTKL